MHEKCLQSISSAIFNEGYLNPANEIVSGKS